MAKTKVTVHDVLNLAADVLFGRKKGDGGEHGWVDGMWVHGHQVCLGAALRVAESKLFNTHVYDAYDRFLSEQPAIDAEKVLAEAILKMDDSGFDAASAREYGIQLDEPGVARNVIVSFNDAGRSEESINEALELADKMVWERELENEIAAAQKARAAGEPVPAGSFVDYLTKK